MSDDAIVLDELDLVVSFNIIDLGCRARDRQDAATGRLVLGVIDRHCVRTSTAQATSMDFDKPVRIGDGRIISSPTAKLDQPTNSASSWATLAASMSAPASIRRVTNDTEAADDILLTMLAALSDGQHRRLVQMIATSAT